jgi:glycosyltransferase involved in cell wall biosynthesis
MTYSFVIPVHNEQANLPRLMAEIDAVRGALDGDSEVIFVNDGSTDATSQALEAIRQRHRGVVIVEFAANAGQSAALGAGFEQASGEVVITLDGDLQNDPADIPSLLRWYPEYDVVIGRRVRRRDSLVKRLSSRVANGIRNALTHESIADTGCSLKVFRASVVKRVRPFDGMHRFLPTLCRLEGATVREVEVSHRPRAGGKSHYGTLNRAFGALHDALAVRWMIRKKTRYSIARVVR